VPTVVQFPYISISIPPTDPFPQGQTVWRPLTRAVISVPGAAQGLRCVVCLDTGADSCVFPAAFAPFLGIDLLTLKKNVTGGVGSSGNVTYYTDLKIWLGPGISFTSLVGFTDAMDRQGIGLLGQAGFFEYYNVRFSQQERRFTIETIDPVSTST
jgi:hypothetical protein